MTGRPAYLLVWLLLCPTLAACTTGPPASAPAVPATSVAAAPSSPSRSSHPSVPPPSPSPTTSSSPSSSPSPAPSSSPSDKPDPRWQFWTSDHRWYSSPWFAGLHRIMIGFGCTADPYYDPDPRCPHHEGFHHGIDVAMPCGTRLYAGRPGVVVDPRSAGALGPAYGPYAFRLRTGHVDIVIGHVRKVYVVPGQHVRRGQLIARANHQGAPDGCHLHFEVRPAGAPYTEAIDPAPYLALQPR